MRKLFIIILFLISGSVLSQIDLRNPTAIGVHSGFFLPYSSEVFKTGVNIGFDVQHKIDPVYLLFNLTYNISSRKNNKASESYNNTSSTGLLEISTGARLDIKETDITYFIEGGMGYYLEKKGSYDIKINGITTSYQSESNSTLGGNIGFGIEYPITKELDLFAKIKYHLYFGVGDSPFLNTYFGLLGGIKYKIRFK